MKIVKLQTVATATNLSEIKKYWSKHEKNVLKPEMHNTKGDTEGQTGWTEKEDWNELQLWFLKSCY